MQKIIGCILIITACTGIGYLKGVDLQKHLTEIQTLRQLFFMMKSEIKYTKAPLGEAFWHIGRRLDGAYAKWMMELSKRLEQKSGSRFADLWNDSIVEYLNDTYLSREDLQKLKSLGGHMGYLDEEMQIGTINLFLEQLETEIEKIRENIAAKRKLCNCLGVMGGIFLAVVLI